MISLVKTNLTLFVLLVFDLTSNGKKEDDRNILLWFRWNHRLVHNDPSVGDQQGKVTTAP